MLLTFLYSSHSLCCLVCFIIRSTIWHLHSAVFQCQSSVTKRLSEVFLFRSHDRLLQQRPLHFTGKNCCKYILRNNISIYRCCIRLQNPTQPSQFQPRNSWLSCFLANRSFNVAVDSLTSSSPPIITVPF